jgi:hypothetical protein
MTTQVPAVREKTQITAGAPVAAIVPQDLDQAFRLSQALAVSGMAPRGMDKPEQIMVAIMAGAELGLAPFQALQSFAIVNNRPTLWGDGLMAVVRARGVKVKETLEGDGDNMVARCHVTRPDTGEEIERAYTVADAKKAGLWGKTGPWQQHPKRMLQMRARAFALRDGCADMLRGVQIREEVEDYAHVRDVTPPRASGLRERLTGPATEEGFSAHHAEPDEPVAFAEHAEEVAEAEFAETLAEEPEAAEPLIDAAEEPPSPWDHMAWAQVKREQADEITEEETLKTWWKEVAEGDDYKALIELDEAEALALKAHVVRRKKAIAPPVSEG